jgi:hypothetical protein
MCNWNIFGAWTNHGQTRIHKTHHSPNLGEVTTFPFIILCAWPWGQHPNVILSYDSQIGGPKFPKLGLLQFWMPITLCVDLWLRWGLEQSYNLCWELFNGMWHGIWKKENQGVSQLLVVGSQIANLTPDFLLAITYVLSTQMGHANPLQTFTFQEIFNGITNLSI